MGVYDWPCICLREDLGRLGGRYLNGLTHQEGLGGYFENLGRYTLVLVRSSREGSRNGWYWGVGVQYWPWNCLWETLDMICDLFGL